MGEEVKIPALLLVVLASATLVAQEQFIDVNRSIKDVATHGPVKTVHIAGDVYMLTTAAFPSATQRVEHPCTADLTGTAIRADHPVGVMVSQTHSSLPCGDNECGDYCVEFIPPCASWDSLYIIAPSVKRMSTTRTEEVKIAFCVDGTNLYANDGTGRKLLGVYNAGETMVYPGLIPH